MKHNFTLTSSKWQKLMELSMKQIKTLKGGLYIHLVDKNFYTLDFRNYNTATNVIERLKLTVINNSIEIKLDAMSDMLHIFNTIDDIKLFQVSNTEEFDIEKVIIALEQYIKKVNAFSFTVDTLRNAYEIVYFEGN